MIHWLVILGSIVAAGIFLFNGEFGLGIIAAIIPVTVYNLFHHQRLMHRTHRRF